MIQDALDALTPGVIALCIVVILFFSALVVALVWLTMNSLERSAMIGNRPNKGPDALTFHRTTHGMNHGPTSASCDRCR